ncbi:hypothetical protein L2520_06655 [Limosilactobacillus vaginalis]|uniref:Uncharacterized protein n=1 Tax=Limosilactobacillus vaginalis TaxID=1633 RepID=A0ABT4K7U3_9LACO|nr:hypothetical protein [Limosilactobacillus vaginalis]MCZ3747095.1 hypothetical protein [Limosilactobacillus vaginalis]MCZ3752077.1 hypothetical protein [Limosilactobacillus vaginalis]MCZ3753719.1 hypothetical protein [Limosilactobacillus vaginalis]MCZ3755501.1 hypothetical protein [Limosilactobacillus vaginalis]MCZ3757153.1 hypothetical protein [Limosilactobacillus vaginalis]
MTDGHLARLTKTLETSGLNKSVSQMSNAVSAVKPTMEAINSIKPFTETMKLNNKQLASQIGK